MKNKKLRDQSFKKTRLMNSKRKKYAFCFKVKSNPRSFSNKIEHYLAKSSINLIPGCF